jgi:hypothetical protein
MNARGNENLKLLLNSAYKKGLIVERQVKEGEKYVVEGFEVYCPIVMANIWGVENVLSDRCVLVILEKSSNKKVTKLIENFENELAFLKVKEELNKLSENITDDLNLFGDLFSKWNAYQENIVSCVNKVSCVSSVSIVSNKEKKIDDIDNTYDSGECFADIDKADLSGRDLELFFPLFIISKLIDNKILKEILETAKNIVKERRVQDREENRDVKLIEFISEYGDTNFVEVSGLAKDFSIFLGDEEFVIKPNSISRSLNRLKLVVDRKNTGKNRQVRVNIEKAKEKLKLFKEPEENVEIIKLGSDEPEVKE